MPPLLVRLGSSHEERFGLRGEREDIEKAIEYTTIALTMTPDDDPGMPGLLTQLGMLHDKRYKWLSDVDDSDESIKYTSLALSLTPDGDPELSGRLRNLGIFHSTRFQHLGGLDDLKKALEYQSRALDLTPSDHPDLPHRLAYLGISYSDRFERLGDPGDIQKAIEAQSRAVTFTPSDNPILPQYLARLSESLINRYNHLDVLDDLERAIEFQSRAVALTPDGHPYFSSRLASLGGAHCDRFERLGEIGDLEKAIKYQSRALVLTPDDHPHLSGRLNNLGVAHINRFERLGELGDLEKVIEYQSRVVKSTPDGHPQLAKRLTVLGRAYGSRFSCLDELGDLEKAIECNTGALVLTPDGHPDLPNWLHNLGLSHADRFERLGEQPDFEKAIECMCCALILTPDGHPSLPHTHFSLARLRLEQSLRIGNPSDLQDALDSFRMASQSLTGSPRDKFIYASDWADLASENSALNPIEAFQTAIDIIPQFIWLGATTNQRYHDLEQVQNLAIRAAAAAILASEYKMALEWLEHGRCVVWNQSLMLRSPLDQLHASHPALATRLQAVADQLHYAGSESRESQALDSGSLTPEQVGQQHRRLAQEYEDLVSRARTLPGFEDFLQPIKANRLVQAAQNGPIVVINCHEDRCDALAILPGQDNIDHIRLPNFTGKKAQCIRLEIERSVRARESKERGSERRPLLEQSYDSASDFEKILKVLWYDIVEPVLDFLKCMNNVSSSSEDLPHITWCPTGALSFLPLHAAGDYALPNSRIFDYVISSYTPTISALLTTTPHSLTHDSRILAAGQANTPGHSSLPGTTRELMRVQTHTQGKVQYMQLMGDQATTAAVLDAMEQHDWVHLACHAHQNVDNPTKSGFFLHDDTLDLAAINRRSFKNKGLAYLSACQTATGDERLPDEAVHLASGMLMAGYSSVIATMWSVRDEDAPFVADRVYGQLLRDGKIGNGEAGRALHNAVAELREEVGEKAFERWVPYIHIGS
ncbi:unnamed protein product [Rhizoctonia solani]|uniref:CHAT domain-containing protein n=1 Tax=Rhizoctonia solani TaxID=456999 RepID=A0A8H3H8Z1_9AGAM|nr:unnamed protein product [Rhizoctonia solani]